jgi:hypothetical protein
LYDSRKNAGFKMIRTILLSGLFITGLLEGAALKAVAAAGSFAFTGSLNTARDATRLPC